MATPRSQTTVSTDTSRAAEILATLPDSSRRWVYRRSLDCVVFIHNGRCRALKHYGDIQGTLRKIRAQYGSAAIALAGTDYSGPKSSAEQEYENTWKRNTNVLPSYGIDPAWLHKSFDDRGHTFKIIGLSADSWKRLVIVQRFDGALFKYMPDAIKSKALR